ncbi:MAG: lycopene cyclase domain-containing protein [Candidatus Hodarchaeota archaeon]
MLTYFTFLFFFIGIPLTIVSIFYVKKYQGGDESRQRGIRKILFALSILIAVAFIYTTPWDNFLVENAIWYYETSKVMGIIIGFVPIEEYIFFIVQTLLIGLFFGWILIRKNKIKHFQHSSNINFHLVSSFFLLIIWFLSLFTFLISIESLTYLNLILLWGLPPIMIQLIFGADILWSSRRDLVLTITLSTIYLAIADAIAISEGIWTISSATSTGILLAGILPVEEFIFFLITNILITFGLALFIDSRSINRITIIYSRVKETISQK